MYFIRLAVYNSDSSKLLSENFYWKGLKDMDFTGLNQLKEPVVEIKEQTNGNYMIVNKGKTTAFFIRLKVIDKSGKRILPVYYSDNYFTLFPGESKLVNAEFAGKGKLVAEPFYGNKELK